MALIKHNATFDQIRVIITCEGFKTRKGFIVKEIGYKSATLSGSIGLNYYHRNFTKRDSDQNNYLFSNLHGININQNHFTWPNNEDVSAVIKSIYLLCENENDLNNKKYIGYNNDLNILSLLHEAGLDSISVNLSSIYENIPSIKNLKNNDSYGFGHYSTCKLHQNCIIKNQCAKVKSILLFEWCINEFKKLS
jgi:hypothetical protein